MARLIPTITHKPSTMAVCPVCHKEFPKPPSKRAICCSLPCSVQRHNAQKRVKYSHKRKPEDLRDRSLGSYQTALRVERWSLRYSPKREAMRKRARQLLKEIAAMEYEGPSK